MLEAEVLFAGLGLLVGLASLAGAAAGQVQGPDPGPGFQGLVTGLDFDVQVAVGKYRSQ